MSYFKQAVEMLLIERGGYSATVVEYLTDKLASMEVELECEKAAKTISLEQGGEIVALNDLYVMVNGDVFDVNTLSALYPTLAIKLDELWDIIDSDCIDNLKEKLHVPQSK